MQSEPPSRMAASAQAKSPRAIRTTIARGGRLCASGVATCNQNHHRAWRPALRKRSRHVQSEPPSRVAAGRVQTIAPCNQNQPRAWRPAPRKRSRPVQSEPPSRMAAASAQAKSPRAIRTTIARGGRLCASGVATRNQICMARLPAARAASFTASVRVGCAWHVRARSSADPPNSMRTAASAISSPACGPMI